MLELLQQRQGLTLIMEAHHVVSFLATELRRRGCQAHLAKPEQIRWREGYAYLETLWHCGPLGALVRFVVFEKHEGVCHAYARNDGEIIKSY